MKEEKDPRIGLKYHGPFFYSDESGPSPTEVKIGVVSDAETSTLTKRLINSLSDPIASQSTNKWLYPDFPGINLDTPIKCHFLLSDNWDARLREADIRRVIDIDDANQRIAAGVNLYRDAVQEISLEDDRPHVIVCALSPLIEERCGISIWTRGAKTPEFTELEELAAEMAKEGQALLDEWGFALEEKHTPEISDRDLDFHNALKGKVMEFNIPIQLLLNSTIRGFFEMQGKREIQEPATVAWNFGTAVYYKANGKPWRLAKLRQDTCYVGISFFHNLLNPNKEIQTSMAQVFTHNGEGIVLRGTDVVEDKITRETHLSQKQAYELMADALKRYEKRAHRNPARVVIHKTTLFSDDEKSGFDLAIGARSRDYITISRRCDYRFLRTGKYPVLRGTMIHLSGDKCVFYTSGYIPRVRTYPGSRVPEPLLITRFGDSEFKEICKEIMGLTKINWNTTAFATVLPITLEFSKRVGRVLSELDKDSPIQDHYRFYM
jgi:hypothetical protein